ncbi:MAG: CPBP family intramembrane metalloprotease [Clostridiales bacterium]|nr:CPBP family intramembrane metalloprotease [Clostridiales bacterium]
MKKREFDLDAKRILIYLVITFAITYVLEIGVIRKFVMSEDLVTVAIGQLMVAMVMFIPAIGVLLTRLLTKEGFKNSWLHPNLKGNVKYYLIAWFAPVVLTIIGAIIYFLINPSNLSFDLEYLKSTYEKTGITIEETQLKATLAVQIVVGLFLSPVVNAITCFGEEWGWRGYLLPKMADKFKVVPTLLITGVIWGLWHAPLTVLGHNYGLDYIGHPYLGIIAMCIFCIVLGTIFSYLSWKTKSCLPAVIAHGSINGFAAVAIYFTKDGGNPFIGPAPTGIIGGIAFIILAIVCALLLVREEKSHIQSQ